MATFAYGRVGPKEQTTENQRLEIERAGYKANYLYAEDGVSGKVSAIHRPQFAKLLNQIWDGETLVVSKFDRLSRDALDAGATIKALATRKIKVVFLQLGKLDLASPAGKMMLAAIGEMKRDLLVKRTQVVLVRTKKEGKTLGRPAHTTAEQRVAIISKYKAGTSISELSRLHGVSRPTIMRIVKTKGM